MSKGVTPLVEATGQFVFQLLRNKLPEDLVYHDYLHTYNTVEEARFLAKGNKISEEDTEILLLAAYLHDIGYVNIYRGHEAESAKMAEEYLKEKGLEQAKIDQIKDCIMATKMPQQAKTLLEEILCDADLSNLAMVNQQERSNLLRLEHQAREIRELSDEDWYKYEIDFLSKHRYFTAFAHVNWNKGKYRNILANQKEQSKLSRRNKENEDKLAVRKLEIDRKLNKDLLPDRGIETMFRTASRTHINLSAIADNKANIMLSVNAVIISVLISGLGTKLDTNPLLLFPTIILLLVCIISIVFATLSTRPKITEGKFSTKDIEDKKTNLLFFGNFYNMDLKEFEWGMKEMMQDKNFLYGSLTRDLYYLGKVLAKKYRFLRYTYTIFMYGLILSVIAFAITFLLMPKVAGV
ncbi:MAG: putative metal-dependent HD superfamily phosphohydrolase [Limisphaerales bacterium]|jgi:predicted metal-dependent HD superfamily phosphohydrolase